MKIKALQSYRWALGLTVAQSFVNNETYDVKESDALQMIDSGYAKKVGAIENMVAPFFEKKQFTDSPNINEIIVSGETEKKEFENKMVDLSNKKKKGRPFKTKEEALRNG